MFEEIGVGSDAKKRLTEVRKNGNLEDRVRVQIYQFDLVEVEETTEEVASREPEPMLDKFLKDYHFAFLRGWG